MPIVNNQTMGTNRAPIGATSARPRGRPASAGSAAPTDVEILDAALEAFADEGYAGTSVRDLARRLGVSHNLLPQRFGSKERLWYAAVDHGFRSLAAQLHVEVAPDDPFETVRNLIVTFVVGIATRPALLKILNNEAARAGPRLDHLFERHIGPVASSVERNLSELQRCGLARPIPRAGFYFLLTHGAAGPLALGPLAERFGHRVSADDPVALREYAESIADLLIHGIADVPAQATARRRRRR
jgi:AcrR family transcriptional regulator